jgi:hypothetical protein
MTRRLVCIGLLAWLAACGGDGALEGTISVDLGIKGGAESLTGPAPFNPTLTFHVTSTGKDYALDVPEDAELVGVDAAALLSAGSSGKRYRITGAVNGTTLTAHRITPAD